MEQRDLLKAQIEQLGKVLAKILSDFLGLKSKGQFSQGIEITNKRLQNELDIDIEKIGALSKDKLKDYLKQQKLTTVHIEFLSEYLKEIGIGEIKTDKNKARMSLEQAIHLLDAADEISKTMSFDRINKKKEIEKVLQQL